MDNQSKIIRGRNKICPKQITQCSVWTCFVSQLLGPFGSLHFHSVCCGGDFSHVLLALGLVDKLLAEEQEKKQNVIKPFGLNKYKQYSEIFGDQLSKSLKMWLTLLKWVFSSVTRLYSGVSRTTENLGRFFLASTGYSTYWIKTKPNKNMKPFHLFKNKLYWFSSQTQKHVTLCLVILRMRSISGVSYKKQPRPLSHVRSSLYFS